MMKRSDIIIAAAVITAAVIAMLTACTNAEEQETSADTALSASVSSEQTEADISETSESETVSETAESTASETEMIPEAESSAPASDDYKTLYRQKLSEYYDDEDVSIMMFDLYDLNSDGTPELFISEGCYHLAGVRVYTVSEGVLADMSGEYGYGSWGACQVCADGYLLSSYSGMGAQMLTYYQMDKNTLVPIVDAECDMLYDDDDNASADRYLINGAEVTEEEYDAALKDFYLCEWVSVGQQYAINEETVNKILE